MCITWCHQRQILYWNHDNCHPVDCPMVNAKHGQCEDCRHRLEVEGRVSCGLTRAELPEQGGCCHWNVAVTQGPQKVTRDTLVLLAVSPSGPELVLNVEDVPHRSGENEDVFVDPDELGLPYTYGLGTDHLLEEEMEWPDWDGSLEA
jgi:hypothetical protein